MVLGLGLALVTPVAARAASRSDEPPPPPILSAELSPASSDGLYRLVVHPDPPADTAAANPGTGTAGGDPAPVTSRPGRAAAQLAGPDPAPSTEPDTTDPDAAELSADDLSQLPGVVSVTPIGDGSFAVTTSRPAALRAATAPGTGTGLRVTPDPQLHHATTPPDPFQRFQWALDNNGTNLATVADPPPRETTNADLDGREAATAAQAQGQGIVVAVVDSGVDFSHPDLAGRSWVNPGEVCGNGVDDDADGLVDDCRGWSFGYDDPQTWRKGGSAHGTHVAGLIAATAGNGIGIAGLAPQARIMDLSLAGPGGMTASNAARAVRYATDHGARVVNLSLGTDPGTPREWVEPLIEAIHYAEAHGVLVVAAAGNSGVDLATTPIWPASIDATNLLVVGASAPDDTAADFSDYGLKVNLFAPGVLIVSTVPDGYAFMSGTSQASPLAAAVAADVLSIQPRLTPSEVIGRLIGTADYVPSLKAKVPGGARLNAARALGVEAGNGP